MEPSKKQLAFRHVIDGRRIVARQRERVEKLARNGCDTTESTRTLDLFVRTLHIFEDDANDFGRREKGGAVVRRGESDLRSAICFVGRGVGTAINHRLKPTAVPII